MLLSIDNARTQNVCSLRTVAVVTRCLLFIIESGLIYPNNVIQYYLKTLQHKLNNTPNFIHFFNKNIYV